MTVIGSWPALPLDEWQPTYETLHRWAQIMGKTRLALSPFENHWWHCALYVSARGLTTSAMPFPGGTVEVELDLIDNVLVVKTSDGALRFLSLAGKSVAAFYREYRALLDAAGVEVRISPAPNELPDRTPFADDTLHATYDGDAARRCWRALMDAKRVLQAFRSRFCGKCSPAHLWWGAFDMACTRFSGRGAPPYMGQIPNCPSYVMTEAYSHECISAGWWPGTAGSPVDYPAFYAYAYPEPAGCNVAPVRPSTAFYHPDMREWILPYDEVRRSADPDATVMAFLESTYAAAAALGNWNVAELRSSRDLVS